MEFVIWVYVLHMAYFLQKFDFQICFWNNEQQKLCKVWMQLFVALVGALLLPGEFSADIPAVGHVIV